MRAHTRTPRRARPASVANQHTRRFQDVLVTVGAHAGDRLSRVWDSLDAYDEDQIPEFTRKADPVLAAAKTVAVHHAVAYYSIVAGIAPIAISAAAVTVVPNLREPFISTWLALKGGASIEDAIAAGAGRTDAVARNFVTSSARQTGDQVVQAAGLKVAGWERVPDGNACPWCLEVAPGFYTSAESADFGHDRCSCSAEPLLIGA